MKVHWNIWHIEIVFELQDIFYILSLMFHIFKFKFSHIFVFSNYRPVNVPLDIFSEEIQFYELGESAITKFR